MALLSPFPRVPIIICDYCDYVKCIWLPESTPPSQNTPLFSTTICDPPRIYPSLPEYTPLFNNYNIMRPSQNLPLPPRIYPPFQQLYATLPESTPPSQNIPETRLFNKHSTLSLRLNDSPLTPLRD